MFRFTMINYLCNDMPQVMDITRPPDRIRQDVSRSPGGDSRVFLNNCIGCHAAMDPMAQAFAYYNYDPTALQLVYTPGQTQAKYHINTGNFPYGFVTPDDSWNNRWRYRAECAAGLERLAARAAAMAPSRWDRNSPAVRHSPTARCRKYFRPSACVRRAMRPIAAPRRRSSPTSSPAATT